MNRYICRLAEPKDIPQMIRLWHTVYGDSEEYITQFYRFWEGKARFFAAAEGEQIVGMYHALPMRISAGGSVYDSLYLYAGAVRADSRGQGIFRALHSMIFAEYLQKNQPVILQPASDTLIPYYASLGFRYIPLGSEMRFRMQEDSAAELTVSELHAEEYLRLRSAFAAAQPCAVRWGKDGLRYAIAETCESGGIAKKITCCGMDFALLGYCREDTLTVTELTAPPDAYSLIFPALCRTFHCTEISCRVPYQAALPARSGMILPADFSAQSIYFPVDYC